MPAHRVAAPGAVVLALAAALVAPSATAQTANPQAVFQRLILNDVKTTPTIKRIVRGAGHVDPSPTFTELTEDSRSDAVVAVESGGVAGRVAVFVFTSATKNGGSGTLRASLRLQSLRRSQVTIGGGAITVTSADYAPGDELCCPSTLVDARYEWDRAAGSFKRTSTDRRKP